MGDLGEQAWGPCGRLPSPPLSTYQTLFLVSGMGLEDLSGVQRGNTQLGAGCDKGPECWGQVLVPGYRGTEGRTPTLTTMQMKDLYSPSQGEENILLSQYISQVLY